MWQNGNKVGAVMESIPAAITAAMTVVPVTRGVAGAIQGGVAAKVETAPLMSVITDVTASGARMLNTEIAVTASQFQANLITNGFQVMKTTVGKNGPVTVLSDGNTVYTIYIRTSTGEAGAQVRNAAGEVIQKISLAN